MLTTMMTKWSMRFVALTLSCVLSIGAYASAPLYSTDFSSDPGWVTDDPSGLYWDSTTQTFRGTQVNTEGTYAVTTIPGFDPTAAWTLEFDSKINTCQWSAGLTFGIFPASLLYPNGAIADRGIADGGRLTSLVAEGQGDTVFSPQWVFGEWYHHIMEYDDSSGILTLVVTHRDSGAHFASASVTVTSFPADTMHLGVSRLMMKDTGPGASPSATVDYEIDNIKLVQGQPELVFNPSTGHFYGLTTIIGTWPEAEAEAVARGGHLVTINNAAENAWLVETFSGTGRSGLAPTRWIGFRQLPGSPEPGGGWVWVSGEPVTYTNWNTGEPNDVVVNERWAGMYMLPDPRAGRWNDEQPSYEYRGIIEFSTPGVLDSPDVPDYDIPEPATASNLVFITHGWNTSTEPNGRLVTFWRPLKAEIETYLNNNAPGSWDVELYEWPLESQTGLPPFGPDLALLRASVKGHALGRELAARNYDHVHFIAHSAGSAMIGVAASYFANTPTTVHTTYLDAYVGWIPFLWDGYNLLYGYHSDWSDSYFAKDGTTGIFTDFPMPYSFDVEVTRLDEDVCIDPFLSSHGWPADYYEMTVSPAAGLCSAFTEYGYGLSKEVMGDAWIPENLRAMYPRLHPTVTLDCGGCGGRSLDGEGKDHPIFRAHYDPPLDLANISYETNSDEFVVVNEGGIMAATGAEGEPAWIILRLQLDRPINFVQVNAEFLSDPGARGLVTVYFDGVESAFIDEQYVPDDFNLFGFNAPQELSAGAHSIAIRVDSFSEVPTSVSISDIQTGFAGFMPVECQSDVNFDGSVGLQDLQILLFNFGRTDATNADGDVNGDGVVDLQLLLFAFGTSC